MSTQRNWSEIAREIDRPLSDWSAESLYLTYLQHGCAIVRNAIDLSKIAEIKELATRIYSRKAGLHIYEPDFHEEAHGRASLVGLIDRPPFNELRNKVFAGQSFSLQDAVCRRIQGSELNQDWQQPLALHLDSQVHPFAFTLNHWIPFQNSGNDIAGIQFLPIDYRATRLFCGFTGDRLRPETEFNFHYFPEGCPSLDVIEQTFGPRCLLRPTVNAGDLVLLSNWIVHGTYKTEAMKAGRMNAEIRYMGEHIDVAEPQSGKLPARGRWRWREFLLYPVRRFLRRVAQTERHAGRNSATMAPLARR
jgi:hypothetical protein